MYTGAPCVYEKFIILEYIFLVHFVTYTIFFNSTFNSASFDTHQAYIVREKNLDLYILLCMTQKSMTSPINSIDKGQGWGGEEMCYRPVRGLISRRRCIPYTNRTGSYPAYALYLFISLRLLPYCTHRNLMIIYYDVSIMIVPQFAVQFFIWVSFYIQYTFLEEFLQDFTYFVLQIFVVYCCKKTKNCSCNICAFKICTLGQEYELCARILRYCNVENHIFEQEISHFDRWRVVDWIILLGY
jgi:hypothetical protein